MNVYPHFLGATEAQQITTTSIRQIPASFKLLFGFVSDNVPLFGYRRKLYMLVGWMMSSLSMLALIMFTNLNCVEVHSDNEVGDYPSLAPAKGAPSISLLSLSVSRLDSPDLRCKTIPWYIFVSCSYFLTVHFLTNHC